MRRDLKVMGKASPIAISEGTARVHDNIFYWNTEREYMKIPAPIKLPRIDHIVLRTDWTKQTVRLARIEGIEGQGPLVLNARAGRNIWSIIVSCWRWLLLLFHRKSASAHYNIYDTALAQCTITPDGVITVIDTWDMPDEILDISG